LETSAKILHLALRQRISKHHEEKESERISRLILESLLRLSWTDIILDKPIFLTDEEKEKLDNCADRLEKQEPIQYILGLADFYGRTFVVNKNVLVPRPETEQLVDLIIGRNILKKPVIVDIGTGSGCIAITLKKEIPEAQVYAFDLSEAALQVAAENAFLQQVEIHFEHLDILNEDPPELNIDILVSNPPYISQDETPLIGVQVRDYEPHQALFADPQDPILIYRQIIARTTALLNDGARIFFEINPRFDHQIVELLEGINCVQVQILEDLQGKNRMAVGYRKA
jgi:release factor glutamine methyltransferase